MLSGSYSTAAAQYMQTIFRVQSAGSIDGRQKTDCYVFDFAPDRTLKVLSETVHLSRKPGKNQKKHREVMTEFLNYCPVISISGSKTKKYSVESMMEQIKQIYAERAVNSGFEDESIYNDELLKLDDIDASKFNELRDIIGSSKAAKKKSEVVVNGQGLTDEQIEHVDDPDTYEVTEKYFPKLKQYVPIVERVHGGHHPEFHEVRKLFDTIYTITKEAVAEKPELSSEFAKLREITSHYTIPDDVCESYEAVYKMLAEVDQAYHT